MTVTVTVTTARNQVALTPDDLRLLIATAERALAWNEETYLCIYPGSLDLTFSIIPKAAYDAEMNRINQDLQDRLAQIKEGAEPMTQPVDH